MGPSEVTTGKDGDAPKSCGGDGITSQTDTPRGVTGTDALAIAPHGGYRPTRRRAARPVDPIEVLERVHTILYNSVWQASKSIMHMEVEWKQNHMVKRIVKYFFKAATSPELLTMQWQQATQQFIEHGMQGYSAACSDRPWFFELDLAPALCAGVWELVNVSSAVMRPSLVEVEEVAISRYEELMDTILLDKAMWDATVATFKDDVLCSKIYKALHHAHQSAFNAAVADTGPIRDLERVEAFTKQWIENTVGRVWQSVDDLE